MDWFVRRSGVFVVGLRCRAAAALSPADGRSVFRRTQVRGAAGDSEALARLLSRCSGRAPPSENSGILSALAKARRPPALLAERLYLQTQERTNSTRPRFLDIDSFYTIFPFTFWLFFGDFLMSFLISDVNGVPRIFPYYRLLFAFVLD